MFHEGKPQLVRRVVLAAKLGRPIKKGFYAVLTCDSPLCVNPAHLEEQSRSKRMAELAAAGLLPKSTTTRTAFARERFGKLDMDKARAIRASDELETVLATRYGVSRGVIDKPAAARRGRSRTRFSQGWARDEAEDCIRLRRAGP